MNQDPNDLTPPPKLRLVTDDGAACEILPPQFTFPKPDAACQKAHEIRAAHTAPAAPKPESILDEAARVTTEERQRYYGHPGDNHGNTADLWRAYLDRRFGVFLDTLNSRDVCMMMILLKVSRDANAKKRDNLVDICGYARNAEQIEERG